MTICLSRDELLELSGYKQAASVKRWLQANGFVFYLGADNWPRVMREQLTQRPKTLTRSNPNMAALLEMQHGTSKNKAHRPA